MKSKWICRVLLSVSAVISAGTLSACKQDIIDHVEVHPSSSLETIRISLIFADKIQSTLSAGFVIKDYGYLFINPYTSQQPFEIGFDLNTSIINDQDYVNLTPTDLLPNGYPIGVDRPIVEIRTTKPVNDDFDLYGYVDVTHGEWIGVATVFKFVEDQFFPPGLNATKLFLPDSQNRPGVIAHAFGASKKEDGSLDRPGGLAVFANVRQLMAREPGKTSILYPYDHSDDHPDERTLK